MKRISVLCFVIAAGILLPATRLQACTNVIISKGASTDGSCIVSYAADSHWLYGELYFHKAADWKPGSKLSIYEWDTNRYLGEIDQIPHTFQTVGNMNEHQLIIGETTYGGRMELADTNGIMDYGSLIYITLQRARTARAAIDTIVSLANRYGYPSEGESFSIADPNEAWVMDLIGKGPDNKGIVWVARRVPDGYICAHANQSRITRFPLDDTENCLYAPDVITFARDKGYFSGSDEEFSFRDAYNPLDFGGARACDARAWAAFRLLGADVDAWTEYAMGHDIKGEMPLFVKPGHKVSVKDVADVMRDHFEGTPMDMRNDIGAGGNALPYRWRPMDFEVDGKTYINERAIATQQTGFWFVAQARGYLPDVLGALLWFGCDDAATSYLSPIYVNTNEVPECFRTGNGNLLSYSPTSAFWICNRVGNACYKMYNYMEPFVRKAADRFENEQMFTNIPSNDAKLLPTGEMTRRSTKRIRSQITEYTVTTAQKQFAAWVKLEQTLLVKFIDGNVKAQDGNGNFLHTKHSEGIPEGLEQPGYTDFWKKAVAREHGSVIEQK